MSVTITDDDRVDVVTIGIPGPPGASGASGELNDLSDVAVTAAAASDVLAHDGVAFRNRPASTFDVRDFGAVGDGATDATVPIQRAIDAAAAAGGGTVVVPDGHYVVDTTSSASGNAWALLITSDNIELRLAPGALLETTEDASVLAALGGAKPSGGAAWLTNHFTAATVYPTSSIAKGVWSITTTTAAHAGQFVAGDWIVIRTGQTVAGLVRQPDAEINQVASVNAGTGVLTLRYPTAKAYAQEWFVAGTTGLTTTTPTANPAPFGVANVTDRFLHNIKITGGTIRASNASPTANGVFFCRQIVGLTIDGCRIESVAGVIGNSGTNRDVRFTNNTIRTERPGASWAWWGADTGSSDILIAHNDVSTTGHDYLHIHEGVARLSAHHNTMHIGVADGVFPAVSVRLRAYDINLHDNHITAAGAPIAGIYVGEVCPGGGAILHNTLVGAAITNHIWIGSSGWQVDGNRPETAVQVFYDNATGLGPPGGNPSQRQQVSSVWVADNGQTPIIATLPTTTIIDAVTIFVYEAFNSDGANLLSVGIDASPQAFAVTTDVSTTGVKAVPLGGAAGWPFSALGGQLTVTAYYTNGGSEPTTGKALVEVWWHAAPWVVA